MITLPAHMLYELSLVRSVLDDAKAETIRELDHRYWQGNLHDDAPVPLPLTAADLGRLIAAVGEVEWCTCSAYTDDCNWHGWVAFDEELRRLRAVIGSAPGGEA